MQNISGFGLRINIIASATLPIGYILTQFADDTDPFDFPSLQLGDSAMGLNGDLLRWSKPSPIKLSLSLVPGGLDDKVLATIMQANRVGKGKIGANDIITLTGIYPDNTFVTLSNGIMTDGIPANSVASAGRLKSKTYSFSFEGYLTV